MSTPTDSSPGLSPHKITSLRSRRRQLHEATIEPTPAVVVRTKPSKPPVVAPQVQRQSRVLRPKPADAPVFHDIAPTTLRAPQPVRSAQSAPQIVMHPVSKPVARPRPIDVAQATLAPVPIPVSEPVPAPAPTPTVQHFPPQPSAPVVLARDQMRSLPVSARVVSMQRRSPAAPISDVIPVKKSTPAPSTLSAGTAPKPVAVTAVAQPEPAAVPVASPAATPVAVQAPTPARPQRPPQLVTDMVQARTPTSQAPARVAQEWSTNAFRQVLDEQQLQRQMAQPAYQIQQPNPYSEQYSEEYDAAEPSPRRKRKGFALAFTVAAIIMFGLGVGVSGAIVHHNAEAQTANVLQINK